MFAEPDAVKATFFRAAGEGGDKRRVVLGIGQGGEQADAHGEAPFMNWGRTCLNDEDAIWGRRQLRSACVRSAG